MMNAEWGGPDKSLPCLPILHSAFIILHCPAFPPVHPLPARCLPAILVLLFDQRAPVRRRSRGSAPVPITVAAFAGRYKGVGETVLVVPSEPRPRPAR